MAYISAEARQELLDAIGEAIEDIGEALGALGAAYEQLDEQTADRLEEELFRPVQHAYGRAKRTSSEFAERYGLVTTAFAASAPPAASRGVKGLLDRAVEAVDDADEVLVALQDSMRPVEVGDPELRAGLAEVRELLGDLRARSRALVRTFGR